MNSKKNKILFIGCNHDQLPYLKNLSNRGFEIIGTDLNDDAPGKNFTDRFYRVSYTDIDGLLQVLKKESFSNEDQIFTASSQLAHVAASICANHASITYPHTENIFKCIDKSQTYPLFESYGISIPDTKYIRNQTDLEKALRYEKDDTLFYLKSDYSKNPNYIYSGNKSDIFASNINWNRDAFFKKQYVLQNSFDGYGIRINIFDKFNEVYDFESGKKLSSTILENDPLSQLLTKLQMLAEDMGMTKWVMKFDVIFNKGSYVALDIGLDPPARMKNHWDTHELNFIDFYINQYVS